MVVHTFFGKNISWANLLHFVCISCPKVCSSKVCTIDGQKWAHLRQVCTYEHDVPNNRSWVHTVHTVHTFSIFCVHLLWAHCAHRAHHEHTVHKKSLKYQYVFPFPGPRWFKKGGRKLLLASRRSDDQRRHKTAGNISDGLRCCIWHRADNPAKMIHSLAGGGSHNTVTEGYIARVHPNALTSRQPELCHHPKDRPCW